MANYALAADMRNRLDGQSPELVPDLCKSTSTVVQDAYMEFLLVNSCGLIDAYLNKHYAVPIVTDASNGFLRELALDLGEYDLWKRAIGDDVPTKVKEAMQRAMDILNKIAEGILAPFGTDGARNTSFDVASDTAYFDESSMDVF